MRWLLENLKLHAWLALYCYWTVQVSDVGGNRAALLCAEED